MKRHYAASAALATHFIPGCSEKTTPPKPENDWLADLHKSLERERALRSAGYDKRIDIAISQGEVYPSQREAIKMIAEVERDYKIAQNGYDHRMGPEQDPDTSFDDAMYSMKRLNNALKENLDNGSLSQDEHDFFTRFKPKDTYSQGANWYRAGYALESLLKIKETLKDSKLIDSFKESVRSNLYSKELAALGIFIERPVTPRDNEVEKDKPVHYIDYAEYIKASETLVKMLVEGLISEPQFSQLVTAVREGNRQDVSHNLSRNYEQLKESGLGPEVFTETFKVDSLLHDFLIMPSQLKSRDSK